MRRGSKRPLTRAHTEATGRPGAGTPARPSDRSQSRRDSEATGRRVPVSEGAGGLQASFIEGCWDLAMLSRRLVHKLEPNEPLPERADGKLVALLDYWRGLCRGAGPPDRRQIDPLDIPALLPSLYLLDRQDGDFIFRLVGERICEPYGCGLKGRPLHSLLEGRALEETREEHRLCADDAAPVFSENTLDVATLHDIQIYQRLLLPLTSQGDRVDTLLGIMHLTT